MPELPEVETIKNDLSGVIVDKKIKQVNIYNSKSVKNEAKDFEKKLIGNCFLKLKRKGKLIIFELKNKDYLLIHLKMTGQLIFLAPQIIIAGGHSEKDSLKNLSNIKNYPDKHSRVEIIFVDKSRLFFNDLRKFGYLKIVNQEELKKISDRFGIEPLQKDFTIESFSKIFKNKKTNLKALLLNQQMIAGLGNIYVDEILFTAKIKPNRPAGSLNDTEIKRIFKETETIIKLAIKNRGTTFNNYLDPYGQKGNFSNLLKVYQKQGRPCCKCGHPIKKIKLAGRGTCFCPHCQK